MQGVGDLGRALLAYSPSLVWFELLHLALDAMDLAEELQRPLADLAAVVDPQLVELPAVSSCPRKSYVDTIVIGAKSHFKMGSPRAYRTDANRRAETSAEPHAEPRCPGRAAR